MRKVLKWVGIALGGLLGLVVLAVIGLLVYGELSYKPRHADRPTFAIKADTSPAGVARGEYLVTKVMGCMGACHSPKDGTPLSGVSQALAIGPIEIVMTAPNLTSDPETGLGKWTDAEIARAIREGIDKDNVELVIMPAFNYHEVSDADISSIVGYLRSMKPVVRPLPPFSANAVGKAALALQIFMPKSAGVPITAPKVSPEPGTVAYGEYMTHMAGCRDCHGLGLNGGYLPGEGPGSLPASNLTPAGELATWTEADFVKAIHSGVRPGGRPIAESMPWKEYGGMTDADLGSIFKYLKSLPATKSGY